MSYKYKNPLNNGYTKVPKTKYKEIIPNYKSNPQYEVYENETCYLIYQFEPLWIVMANILLLPILIVAYGILNVKEIFIDLYKLIFQKKTGSFISEIRYKDKMKQKSINKTLNKIK